MAKDVLVNGKSMAEIERELTAPFNPASFKTNQSDGNKYLPVEEFESRFNAVFGLLHYDKVVSPVSFTEIGGKHTVSITMSITVYDDDGNRLLTRSANGAKDIIIVNDTGKPKSIKSDISGAESDAFKQICKSFGIAVEQLRELSFTKDNTKGSHTGTAKKESENGQFTVELKTPFTRGNRFITAQASDQNGQMVKLMIFEKSFPEIEKKGCSIESFISGMKPGQSFSFTGRYVTYNGTLQLIFDGDLAKAA